MMNAISGNDMKKLALSRDFKGSTDHHFAHKIKTGNVTNQESSGRCWLVYLPERAATENSEKV